MPTPQGCKGREFDKGSLRRGKRSNITEWFVREDGALPFGQKHVCKRWRTHVLNLFWCSYLMHFSQIFHI